MNDRQLFISVAKGMVLLLLAMLACKYTMGGGALVIAVLAFGCALTGRLGWALMAYILFPFMVVTNPYLVPKNGITTMVLRLGPMFVTLGLMVAAASRQGRHELPLGMMWIYLVVAAICSVNGYAPTISYLKVVNCVIFFLGLTIGLRNIDKRPQDVMTVRKFLIVLVAFLVCGSWFVRIFMPGVAYVTSLRAVLEQEGAAAADVVMREVAASGGIALFAGILNQSQALGTVLPCSLAWLACDMFFVEKRISKIHVLILLLGLPLVYMTRSRSAMLTSVVATAGIYFYCISKVNIRKSVRQKLRTAMTLFGVLVAVAALVMEIKDQSITKWFRKTNDLAADTRSTTEAFTSSRQGLIENNMADFRRNPIFGSGFQVSYDMQYSMKSREGLVLSASIEKGLLPLMVLGETGIVGAIVFALYLIVFYSGCVTKRLYCTATLHTVLLVTNLAEATYFSPGGIGGIMWVLSVAGGFVIDTIALHHHRLEAIARRQQLEWQLNAPPR